MEIHYGHSTRTVIGVALSTLVIGSGVSAWGAVKYENADRRIYNAQTYYPQVLGQLTQRYDPVTGLHLTDRPDRFYFATSEHGQAESCSGAYNVTEQQDGAGLFAKIGTVTCTVVRQFAK